MSYMSLPFGNTQSQGRTVPPAGPKSARIALIGEAAGAQEIIQLRSFCGPAGSVLDQCLQTAGLIRSNLYITNVVKVQPKGNDISPYYNSTTGRFTPAGDEWVGQLLDELNGVDANIFIPLGQVALSALTGVRKIMKYRGYVMESKGLSKVRKVLPTIHPAASLRGKYIYRYMISGDLKKAKGESEFPEIRRPERKLIYNFSDVREVLAWLDYYSKAPIVSFDIEVMNYEMACISFASDPWHAVSIPLDSRWTLEEEVEIWKELQRVLGNPKSIKVAQNAIFDTQFLLTRCGIKVEGPIHDTMIAHSIMFPELPKGLEYLVSVYCGAQQYYKDMIKWDNIKQES